MIRGRRLPKSARPCPGFRRTINTGSRGSTRRISMRHRVRRRRRPSQRRSQALSVRHPRLRQDVDEHRQQSAAVWQHPGRPRGSEEQGSSLRRHRVRAVLSLDGGKQWQRFMNNLPTARVDDILVHPRDNDLIVATHARSIWIADDITPLQQMASVALRTSSCSTSGPRSRISPIVSAGSRPAGRRPLSARTRRAGRRSTIT